MPHSDPVARGVCRRHSDNRRRGNPARPLIQTKQISLALYLDYEELKAKGFTIDQSAEKLGVSRSTINRTIRRFR